MATTERDVSSWADSMLRMEKEREGAPGRQDAYVIQSQDRATISEKGKMCFVGRGINGWDEGFKA